MTTLEDRLKELLEIEAKIELITAYKEKEKAVEEKKETITKLKDELKTQNALVATVDSDLLELMSASASRSKKRREKGETTDISESVTKAWERIEEINKEIPEAEEELELWQAELEKLQGDLDNVSLDSLEQLQEDKQRLERH
jgi:peptidoglycan hydrolase CwlO-like protein